MKKTIPKRWVDVKLKDLLLKTDSGAWGENGTCNDIPVLRSTNITNNGQLSYEKLAFRKFSEKNKFDFLKHGDMLIEKSGGSNDWSVGRVVYFDETENHYYFANFMQRIRVNPKKTYWKYIFYFLFDFYRRDGTKSLFQKTTGIQNLRTNEYLLQHILLPPLYEQRKIAAILSSVDNAIEKTKAVIEQTKVLKKGLMQELLTRGIPGRHKKFKKTPIGKIPEEWEVVKLREIAHIQTGIAINKKIKVENSISVPYLRVANVQDGFVDLSEVKYISVDKIFLKRYLLQKGNVLFNEGGDNDKLGRGCVWEATIDPCIHQNHVFAVHCTSKVSPYYLALYAESPKGKEYFLSASKQTTNLASMNSSQLKLFPIPLPSLEEQQQIIYSLKAISKIEASNSSCLINLHEIKSALMQVLLTGEKRVTI